MALMPSSHASHLLPGVRFMATARQSILGPSYAHHRRLIALSRNWSADEIRDYQERRFQPLVRRYGQIARQKNDYHLAPRHYTRWGLPGLKGSSPRCAGGPFPFRRSSCTSTRVLYPHS
jgi:hypothetical protein